MRIKAWTLGSCSCRFVVHDRYKQEYFRSVSNRHVRLILIKFRILVKFWKFSKYLTIICGVNKSNFRDDKKLCFVFAWGDLFRDERGWMNSIEWIIFSIDNNQDESCHATSNSFHVLTKDVKLRKNVVLRVVLISFSLFLTKSIRYRIDFIQQIADALEEVCN